MNMTKAEQSLMTLILTVDMNNMEKIIAGKLAEKYPEGEFYYKAGRTKDLDQLAFKYKVKLKPGLYNIHLWFASSGEAKDDIIRIGMLKAGKVGDGLLKLENNQFYIGLKSDLAHVKMLLSGFNSKLAALPEFLEKMIKSRTEEADRIAQRRTHLQASKRNNKEAVFLKHRVKSTPETELLYSVVSRFGTLRRINKAFGELLPLIQ
jgi:hypothetical protein